MPRAVISPATLVSSLIATGTPSSGRRVAAAAAAVGLVGLDQRALGEDDAEGVERRVEPRDALEVRLGQLARGELAGGDQLGLAREAGEHGIGGHGHGGGGYHGPMES